MNSKLLEVMKSLENEGFITDGDAIKRFEIYRDYLICENEKYNLTAITQPDEIDIKHFADCLLFASRVEPAAGQRVCDVGSGAGFPGMVLKIARPEIELTLIDAQNKRINFLSSLAAELGLTVNALHLRAEEAGKNPDLRESFDLVTARAVAAMPVLAELCLPLAKQNGRFAAMKGPLAEDELKNSGAIKILGGEKPRIITDILPDGSERRTVICKKISQTPTKYPRAFAKILKQPL